MNRMEFMGILAAKLSDISEGERREALKYYEDYFNDAGVENEQEVMTALGSPAQVAENIKAGLRDGAEGEFTERGYEGGTAGKKEQVSVRNGNPYEQNPKEKQDEKKEEKGTEPKNRKDSPANTILKIIIIALLVIFFSPVIIPVAVAVISVVLALWCVVLVLGLALGFSGILILVFGMIKLFMSPLTGIIMLGIGLFCTGIGILLTILGIWIILKLIPPIFRGIVNLFRIPFDALRRRMS